MDKDELIMYGLKKILYVENDPASVLLLKRILSKDFHFDSANSDKEAIQKIEENNYDLILMDINLNCEMNGEDLMRLFRRIPNTTKIPIFALLHEHSETKGRDF